MGIVLAILLSMFFVSAVSADPVIGPNQQAILNNTQIDCTDRGEDLVFETHRFGLEDRGLLIERVRYVTSTARVWIFRIYAETPDGRQQLVDEARKHGREALNDSIDFIPPLVIPVGHKIVAAAACRGGDTPGHAAVLDYRAFFER